MTLTSQDPECGQGSLLSLAAWSVVFFCGPYALGRGPRPGPCFWGWVGVGVALAPARSLHGSVQNGNTALNWKESQGTSGRRRGTEILVARTQLWASHQPQEPGARGRVPFFYRSHIFPGSKVQEESVVCVLLTGHPSTQRPDCTLTVGGKDQKGSKRWLLTPRKQTAGHAPRFRDTPSAGG